MFNRQIFKKVIWSAVAENQWQDVFRKPQNFDFVEAYLPFLKKWKLWSQSETSFFLLRIHQSDVALQCK